MTGSRISEPRHPPSPPVLAPGARRLADRFELLRCLGQGGMGTVYLARDAQRDRKVAVKVLRGADPLALALFKQEFRALAGISHPNLIVLHELLYDAGMWLFSMDYVEGRDFLQHVCALEGRTAPTLLEIDARQHEAPRRAGELVAGRSPLRDEATLRRVLVQLVDAVRSLHAAGKLHLDLKPSNVLVAADDHVTVLDFGLARDHEPVDQSSMQHRLGTPAYMAPEQAEHGRCEPASDWYALGVMLYEALTGRLPFDGPSTHILLSKVSRDPDPPRALCRDVPPRLEQLCMALLAREPSQRPSGAQIMARLGRTTKLRRPAPPPAAAGEPFVGRAPLLEALRARARVGAGACVVLIHGPSGVGKTALARRLLEQLAAEPDALVLRGACYEREAMPFKAFDGVVDALVASLRQLSPSERRALLPRGASALARLFPAFAALSQPAEQSRAEAGDPTLGRARAFRALTELLRRLAARYAVTLFIDDLHWSDLDSAQLVRALFKPEDPVPLLLVGTYRPEEASHTPLLEALRELAAAGRNVRLEEAGLDALEPTEATGLAAALLARAAPRAGPARRAANLLAAQIARESQGVPLFVHELVRYVAREQRSPARQISLRSVLTRQIAALPKSAAELLDVLAVAGGPVPQRVVFRAARLRAGHEAALHTLRVAALAKSRAAPAGDLIEIAHDRLRELVLSRLSGEGRARLHAHLLEAFYAEAEHDQEKLLLHSAGAGLRTRALAHAERAAAHAMAALAFHRSAELYRIALQLAAARRGADRSHHVLLLTGLAGAFAAGGRCLDAADAYLQAAALAGPERRLQLECQAAEQLLRSGDVPRGAELLRRVLARVGVRTPESPREALAALAFERAQLFARGLAFEERAPDALDPRVRERLAALRGALGVYWLVEPMRGALFATLYLRQALDAGHARHVLRGLITEAAYVALSGGAKAEARAAELHAAARALRERVPGCALRGSQLAEATYHAIYDRKQQSRECARAALAPSQGSTLSWEQACARFVLYQSSLYLGGYAQLTAEIDRCVDDAEARRDRFAVAILLPALAQARLAADEPQRAHEALARLRSLLHAEVFNFLDLQALIWTARSLQYEDQPEAALEHCAAHAGRFLVSGTARLAHWRASYECSLMLAHLAAAARDPRPERRVQAALTHIRRIERERAGWPSTLATVGRAALHHLAGNAAKRDGALARAVRRSEALGFATFAALFARSQALLAGDRGAAARHEQRLRTLGVASPQRWQRLWAPGLR